MTGTQRSREDRVKTDWESEKEKLEGTKREADRDAESEEKAERLSATEKRGNRKGRNRRKQSHPEREPGKEIQRKTDSRE